MFIKISSSGEISILKFEKNASGDVAMVSAVEQMQKECGGNIKDMKCAVLDKCHIHGIHIIANSSREAGVICDDKVNHIASILYGVRAHGHILTGDVLLVWEPWNYNGGHPELRGMNTLQVMLILYAIYDMTDTEVPDDLWDNN